MLFRSAADATCEADGNIEYWTCTTCGKLFSDSQALTEIASGDEVLAALGHKYGAWTSMDSKWHQRICANDASHVEKEKHTFDSGKITKEATLFAEGVKTHTCSVCKAEKTESIAKPELAKVTGKKTVGGYEAGTMNVAFDAVTNATDYEVAWRVNGTDSWKSALTGGKTTYQITGLNDDLLYDIRVRAVAVSGNSKAYGPWSAQSHRWFKKIPFTLKAGDQKLTVSFTALKDADSYTLEWSDSPDYANAQTATIAGTKSTYTITGLTNGTKYYVRLRPVMQKDGVTYTGIYKKGSKKLPIVVSKPGKVRKLSTTGSVD